MTDIEKYSDLNIKMDICRHEIMWCKEIAKKATSKQTLKKIAEYAAREKATYDNFKKEQSEMIDSIVDRFYKVDDSMQRMILTSRFINNISPKQIAEEHGWNRNEYRVLRNKALQSYKKVTLDDE